MIGGGFDRISMRSVFVSPGLSPVERDRAIELLKLYDSNIVVTASSSSSCLRVLPRSEFADIDTQPFAISLQCLSQMVELQVNPFTFEYRRSLVNLFLYPRALSIVSLNKSETLRLSRMIEMMGGTIKRTKSVDYVISSKRPSTDDQAIFVQPAWIDALFGSNRYVGFGDFQLHSVTTSPKPSSRCNVSPACSQSQKPQLQLTMENHSILSFMPPRHDLISSPRETVKLRLTQRRSRNRNAFANVQHNTKVDDYFRIASQATQNPSDDEIEEITLPGEQPLSQTGSPRTQKPAASVPCLETVVLNRKPKRIPQPKPEPIQTTSPNNKKKKPALKSLSTNLFFPPPVYSDLSSEEDEAATSPQITAEDKRLADLCSALLSSKRSPRPAPPVTTSDLSGSLEPISQKDESENHLFDIRYEAEPQPEIIVAKGDRDPLVEVLSHI